MKQYILKGEFRRKGYKQAEFAKEVGISPSRFSAKLNGRAGATFTIPEIKAIEALLEFTPETTYDIFLS